MSILRQKIACLLPLMLALHICGTTTAADISSRSKQPQKQHQKKKKAGGNKKMIVIVLGIVATVVVIGGGKKLMDRKNLKEQLKIINASLDAPYDLNNLTP